MKTSFVVEDTEGKYAFHKSPLGESLLAFLSVLLYL